MKAQLATNIPSKYLSQINYNVNCILESRLLLEEDLEFILHVHDWHAFLKAKICSKYRLAFAAVSSIVSVSLMVISKANILTVFFLLPPSLEAIFLLQQKYSEICLKRNIRSLIDSLKNLSRLNVEIANYLKTREIVRITTNAEPLTNISWESKERLHCIFAEEIRQIGALMNKIELLSKLLQPGTIYPEEWDMNQLNLNEFEDYEKCLENFTKLRDINTLITSKFLSSVAISLCPRTWTSICCPLESVLGSIIPEAEKAARKCLREVEISFNKLRFSFTATEKHKKERSSPPKFILKADQPLLKCLNHMQIAFELGQHIRQQLLKTNGKSFQQLNDSILQLKDQLHICDQSFDCFCKIYGVIVKHTSTECNIVKKLEPHEAKDDKPTLTIRHDDDSEPAKDEEYDLYIGLSDDDESDHLLNNYEDEQSTVYLSEMLEELKSSLKERNALRAARLGISCPAEETKAVKEEKRVEVDLPTMPPLPPKFSFETNADFDPQNIYSQGRSVLSSAIKHAAAQRGVKEDTFGDSFDESESDDDIS